MPQVQAAGGGGGGSWLAGRARVVQEALQGSRQAPGRPHLVPGCRARGGAREGRFGRFIRVPLLLQAAWLAEHPLRARPSSLAPWSSAESASSSRRRWSQASQG